MKSKNVLNKPTTPFPAEQPAILTDEPGRILEYVCESLTAHIPVALVTLVEIRGGSSRSLGAQMAVRGDGHYCGFISGGCIEAAVAAAALEALLAGQDRYLKLGEGSPFFDIVLPCGGGITLSIHVIRRMDVIETLLRRMQLRLISNLCYDPVIQNISIRSASGPTGWDDGKFIIRFEPRARVILCGRSIELAKTQEVADAAGFEVHVCESCKVVEDLDDEFSAIVILYHDLDRELPFLRAALKGNAFYIGALGSSRTHEKRSAALRAAGYRVIDIERIRAPIGLVPKARSASAIALSIIAEVVATRSSLSVTDWQRRSN